MNKNDDDIMLIAPWCSVFYVLILVEVAHHECTFCDHVAFVSCLAAIHSELLFRHALNYLIRVSVRGQNKKDTLSHVECGLPESAH